MADENIVIKINMDSKDFDGGADKVEEQLRGIGNAGEIAVGSMLGDAIVKVSEKMLDLGKQVYEIGTTFEKSFAKVTTLTPAGVAIDDLRQNVIGLSNETGVASDALNEGLYQALSAGVKITGDGSDALKFMNKNVKLAEGGFTDMATAVDTTTTVINAYGLAAEDVSRVSDILISTQNEGKTTVAQLGAVMGQVVPTAANLGVSFEQVGATMAAMTAQGIPTAQAATQIRQALVELSKSGQVASNAFKEASGKSFPDFIAAGGNMQEAMQLMSDYAKKTGKRINDLFGSVEAANTALVLASDTGGAKFVKSLDTMNNSAGATDKAFATMTNTVGYKMDKAFNKMKNSAIKVFDGLAPMIEIVANIIDALGDALNAMPKPMADFVAGFGAVIAVAGPAVVAIGLIKTAITALGTTINTVFPIIGLIAAAVGAVAAIAGSINPVDEELKEFTATCEELHISVSDLKTEFEDLNNSETGSLEVQSKQADKLIDSLDGLIGKTNLTKVEQIRLEETVSALNDIYPEWNLKLDENNQLINGNTGEIIDNVESLRKQAEQIKKNAKLKAQEKLYIDLVNKRAEAENAQAQAIAKVQDALLEQNKGLEKSKYFTEDYLKTVDAIDAYKWNFDDVDNGVAIWEMFGGNVRESYNALSYANAAVKENQELINQADSAWDEAITIQKRDTEAKKENTAAAKEQAGAQSELATAIEDGTTKIIDAYGKEIAVNQDTADEFKKAMDSRVESATNAFDVIEQKDAISLKKMAKNIRKNAEAFKKYNENLVLLKGSKIDPTFLQQLADLGPSGANILEEVANEYKEKGDAAFDEINAACAEGGAAAVENVALGMDGATQLVRDSAGNLVNAVTGEIAVKVSEGTPAIVGASQAAANAAVSAWETVPEAFRKHATDAVTGVATNLSAGIPQVHGASFGIYDAATGQIMQLPTEYSGIATNAATMFANGQAGQIPTVKGSTMQLYDAATGALIPLPAELAGIASKAGGEFASNIDAANSDAAASSDLYASTVKGNAEEVGTSNTDMADSTKQAADNMKTAFGDVATQMGTDADRINNALKSVVDSIDDVNSKTITIKFDRNIKVPTFNMSGAFNAQTGQTPSVSVGAKDVQWFAKGGIFYNPAIVGVGDVPEAAVPLDRLVPLLSAAWKEVMQDQQAVAGLKNATREAIAETNVVVSRRHSEAMNEPSMFKRNEMNIDISMPITINGKMTDKEIDAATDKLVYAMRKKIGKLVL